jgi:hypothetical protein
VVTEPLDPGEKLEGRADNRPLVSEGAIRTVTVAVSMDGGGGGKFIPCCSEHSSKESLTLAHDRLESVDSELPLNKGIKDSLGELEGTTPIEAVTVLRKKRCDI